jgi:ubiquinone biosynthesis protein UbiJ
VPALSFAGFARRAANATWRDVDWARAQLLPYAGKTLRIEIWPPAFAAFTLRIAADGGWDDANGQSGQEADAILRLTPALLPKLVTELAAASTAAPDKPGAALDLKGEPALVQALRDLLDVLPLVLEEKVSAVIGPIATHGVSSVLRAVAAWPGHAAARIGAGLAAYLTEESATLLKRSTFAAFAGEVAALGERVDRLVEDG